MHYRKKTLKIALLTHLFSPCIFFLSPATAIPSPASAGGASPSLRCQRRRRRRGRRTGGVAAVRSRRGWGSARRGWRRSGESREQEQTLLRDLRQLFFWCWKSLSAKGKYSGSNAGPTTPKRITGGTKAGPEIIWEERDPTPEEKSKEAQDPTPKIN